jgi:hypothetical protein
MLANVFGFHFKSEPGCGRPWVIYPIAIEVPLRAAPEFSG